MARRRRSSPGRKPCAPDRVWPWLLFPFHDDGRAAVPVPERAAGPVRQREIAVLDLDRGVSLAAQLTHGLDHLGHPAPVRGVVVAQPAAGVVERNVAGAGNEIAVRHEFPAIALLAEPEILDLHHHGDGKAVVDGGILDVGGPYSRLLEGARARPHGAAEAQIDLAAHLVLGRFGGPQYLYRRAPLLFLPVLGVRGARAAA